MKTFELTLTKSYKVKIKAASAEDAKQYAEFFTGDITDISNAEERSKHNFKFLEIECVQNDAIKEL